MKKLFVDDLRMPVGSDWVIVRSSEEAINWLRKNGMPDLISFDHDLGGEDTAIKIVNWIIERVLDECLFFHDGFEYTVHSANPVGRENIIGKMEAIIKHTKKEDMSDEEFEKQLEAFEWYEERIKAKRAQELLAPPEKPQTEEENKAYVEKLKKKFESLSQDKFPLTREIYQEAIARYEARTETNGFKVGDRVRTTKEFSSFKREKENQDFWVERIREQAKKDGKPFDEEWTRKTRPVKRSKPMSGVAIEIIAEEIVVFGHHKSCHEDWLEFDNEKRQILAVDVHYGEKTAKAVGVLFYDRKDEKPSQIITATTPIESEYEPGNFYKRELPCILNLLKQVDLSKLDTIIVDGYVYLDDKKPGLGKILQYELEKLEVYVDVIGVAKTQYKDVGRHVERGKSKTPLYITFDSERTEDEIKKFIEEMHGDNRIPTMLKLLDRETKGE